MNQEQKEPAIKKFLSEIQVLKRVHHEGMKLAGVPKSNTLGEHAVTAAQIAYVLGELEGADPAKCAVINLFHDNHEIRIGDHHKVSARYLDTEAAERQAESEHLANLPPEIADRVQTLLNEKRYRDTKEGIIAQDADWLEVAIEAKVQVEQGYKGCQVWINNVQAALETNSAKHLLQEIIAEDDFTNCWWYGLKKMTYKKLK